MCSLPRLRVGLAATVVVRGLWGFLFVFAPGKKFIWWFPDTFFLGFVDALGALHAVLRMEKLCSSKVQGLLYGTQWRRTRQTIKVAGISFVSGFLLYCEEPSKGEIRVNKKWRSSKKYLVLGVVKLNSCVMSIGFLLTHIGDCNCKSDIQGGKWHTEHQSSQQFQLIKTWKTFPWTV